MTTEIRECKIVGGQTRVGRYVDLGPGSGLSGGQAMTYDAALAKQQQKEAVGNRAHAPIDITIRRLWSLALRFREATACIEGVIDRAHGQSSACSGEGQPDQFEPVTLAEKLERAVDAIDRCACELMVQADRARSIA